jgi:hypothetical protein
MPVALHNVSVAMYNFSACSYISCQCQGVFQLYAYIHCITFFNLSRITSRISNRQMLWILLLLLLLLLLMCPAIGLSVFHIGCVSKEFSFRVRNAISFKLTHTIGRYFSEIITRCYNCIKIYIFFCVFPCICVSVCGVQYSLRKQRHRCCAALGMRSLDT